MIFHAFFIVSSGAGKVPSCYRNPTGPGMISYGTNQSVYDFTITGKGFRSEYSKNPPLALVVWTPRARSMT
jgi:hypothetical protein